jgi:catalase
MATGLIAALGMHRAWDRTPLVAASMVPPAV